MSEKIKTHKVLFTRENDLTQCVEDVIFDCETRKIQVLDRIPYVILAQINRNNELIYDMYSAGSQFGCGVKAVRLYGKGGVEKAVEVLNKIFKALVGDEQYEKEIARELESSGISRDGDLLPVLSDGDQSTETLVRLESGGERLPEVREGAQEGAEGKVVPFSTN